ncbi:hypothetical protein DSUL_20086 [Desulfovibrionales bacterium]
MADKIAIVYDTIWRPAEQLVRIIAMRQRVKVVSAQSMRLKANNYNTVVIQDFLTPQ